MPANDAPLVSYRGERVQTHLVPRVLWRYLITGRALHGGGDNATFLHHATVDYRARPVLKLTRRKWERLARRHAALTLPAALWLGSPWCGVLPLELYAGGSLLAGGTWAGFRTVEAARTRALHREWVDPAAAVACRVLGVPYRRRRARKMIDIPRDWGSGADRPEERQSVRLHLPAGTALSASLRKQLVENVGNRLGVPNPMADWREAGSDVSVDIKASPVPPKEVALSSIMKAIKDAPDSQAVVGRASGGGIVSVSTEEDAPHFAFSGPSGTGKSVLGKLFLSQRLWRGDGVIFLDPKRWSHWRWAGGGKLPTDRAIYAYRTQDLHNAWMSIAEESERRIELDEHELAQLRRVWICVEEINTQTKRLTRYWKGERKRIMNAAKAAQADDMDYDEADLDPPLTSPAVVAMQEAVGMGRELKMHVVVMAQRLSASVFGGNGGDVRESFQGGRFIAKWDRKLWKMLVDTIDYVACPVGTRGIWGLARGEEFSVFRVPFMSDVEATRLATSGPEATGPVLGPQDRTAVREDTPTLAIGQPVKLSEALASLPGQDGPHALSLDGLRSAAKRPGFPLAIGRDGRAALYDLASLVDWRESVLAGRLGQ